MRGNRIGTSLKAISWELPTILLVPLLLMGVNQNWLFNPSGTLDSWFYFGYFIRFEQYLKAFPEAYYGTRLSWLIPGHLSYSLFPPLLANYVLHISFFWIATLCLYFILKYTVGQRTALFSAVLMGCYAPFIIAIGWDYIDGPGITYFLLTTLMITGAARSQHWQLFLLLSGGAYAALIHTNFVWLSFALPLIVYYFRVNQRHRRNRVIPSIGMAILGIVLATFLMGVFNYFAGGNLLFFMPSIKAAIDIGGSNNPLKADLSQWLPFATWLLIPAFTLVGAIMLLVSWRRQTVAINPHILDFQILFLLSFSVLLFWQLKGVPLLQFSYYASYLIPSTFLALGSQLDAPLNQLKPRYFSLMVLGVIILSLVSYGSALDRSFLLTSTVTLSICLLGVWFLFSRSQGGLQTQFPNWLMLLVIINLFHFASTPYLPLIHTNQTVVERMLIGLKPDVSDTAALQINFPTRKADFLATVDAQRLLKQIDPEVRLRFWYSFDESPVYRSVAAATLWGYRLISEKFPSVNLWLDPPDKPPDSKQLKSLFAEYPKVAILSSQKNAFAQADHALNQVGFRAKLLSEYPIHHPERAFTITIIEVSEKSG